MPLLEGFFMSKQTFSIVRCDLCGKKLEVEESSFEVALRMPSGKKEFDFCKACIEEVQSYLEETKRLAQLN